MFTELLLVKMGQESICSIIMTYLIHARENINVVLFLWFCIVFFFFQYLKLTGTQNAYRTALLFVRILYKSCMNKCEPFWIVKNTF